MRLCKASRMARKIRAQHRRLGLLGNAGVDAFGQPLLEAGDDEVIKQLPPPDDQMRAAGLGGRLFLPSAITKSGETPALRRTKCLTLFETAWDFRQTLIYKFDYNGARFIFLWTGKDDERLPTAWGATRPSYEEQIKQLKLWMNEAKAAASGRFSSASITRYSPVPAWAPSQTLRIRTRFLRPTPRIWTSSSSTARAHDRDLRRRWSEISVAGGGGAEQYPILPGRTSLKVPANYPPDLYWKGQPPQEEYNYVLWMWNPARRPNSRSIASVLGRLSRSKRWNCGTFLTPKREPTGQLRHRSSSGVSSNCVDCSAFIAVNAPSERWIRFQHRARAWRVRIPADDKSQRVRVVEG